MGRLFFFISEAFRALRRQAAPSLAAIVTIVVTTLLLGVLVPVLQASEGTASDVREQIGLNVFLYSDVGDAQVGKVRQQILAIDHVTDAEFVSKAEAVKDLRKRLEGDLKDSLDELRSNPLPPSFDVSLDSPDNLESVISALQPPGPNGEPKPISPDIEEVNERRQDATDIREVTAAIKIVLGVIAVLLLIASLLLVANTIRLSIYARRREVEVMRLVGATNWFIRWPFMIEGVIVGLVGAVIATGILTLGKVTIFDPLAESFDLIDSFSTTPFGPLVLGLIASAVLVSALGSGLTLRRFLRV